MKPLAADWKERLCAVPERSIKAPPTVYLAEKADWADHEYGRLRHPDGRLRERIKRMGRAWLTHLGAPLLAIFPDKAARKAAYRVLSNDRVTMDHILESHQAATAERCARERVVLAIQDTTTLNYDGLRATEGRVGIGGRGSGAQGLLAHVDLAVTPQGRTLGVYMLDADFRDDGDDKESRRWLEGLERDRELQAACPSARVITVRDREADMWEMFQQAARDATGLVVRASRVCKRKVITGDGTRADLWAHVAAQPACARKRLTIDACGGPRSRKKRETDLELRVCRVRLAPPKTAASQTPVDLIAFSATETTPPDEADPLHWLLLTTEGEPTPQQAHRIVSWYESRWAIETWFSVLKTETSTRVTDRQLDTADDLRKRLAFDAVTACHVHDLNFMARTEPDTPAHTVLDPEMIACLYIFRRLLGIRRISRAPPDLDRLTIRTFVIDLANAAGFDSTKRKPLPGTRKLWEAWIRFQPAWIQYQGMMELGWTPP